MSTIQNIYGEFSRAKLAGKNIRFRCTVEIDFVRSAARPVSGECASGFVVSLKKDDFAPEHLSNIWSSLCEILKTPGMASDVFSKELSFFDRGNLGSGTSSEEPTSSK